MRPRATRSADSTPADARNSVLEQRALLMTRSADVRNGVLEQRALPTCSTPPCARRANFILRQHSCALAMTRVFYYAALAFAAAAYAGAAGSDAPARMNVLFFVCDDLRPSMNAAYSKPEMHTPNFDLFAATALTFNRAYTNFAICSPSRNSFMSGRAPDTTRVWNFRQDFRAAGVDKEGGPGASWVTLPEHFKRNDFLTLGHGKLYHPGKPPQWDEPKSWSQLQPCA